MFGGSTQTLSLFMPPLLAKCLQFPPNLSWGLLSSPFVTLAAGHSCVETHLWFSSGAALRAKLIPLGLSGRARCCCRHTVLWAS